MTAVALTEYARTLTNPLDLAEQLILERDWLVERPDDSELIAEVEGVWCNYRIWFAWQPDLNALMFTCSYDMKVAASMRARIHSLLAAINERLWIGHFDLGSADGVLMYRQGVLLAGSEHRIPPEQLTDLIDIALSECDRFYPAFQSVLWGGLTIEDALLHALIDTVGEA